jgi:hypothetical protein
MNHYSLSQSPFNQLYQETIDEALIEFKKFFEIKILQKLCLIFLYSRQQFDDICGRKTEPFETALSTANLIFMMAEEVYEQESNKKFNPQYNLLTIRHEVCHKFFQRSAWTSQPVWLNEGTSMYLSGQLNRRKKIDQFSNFLLFNSSNFVDGQNIYQESGFVVEKLIEKFGRKQFLNFLQSIRPGSKDFNFDKIFNKTFGFKLTYDNINKL